MASILENKKIWVCNTLVKKTPQLWNFNKTITNKSPAKFRNAFPDILWKSYGAIRAYSFDSSIKFPMYPEQESIKTKYNNETGILSFII